MDKKEELKNNKNKLKEQIKLEQQKLAEKKKQERLEKKNSPESKNKFKRLFFGVGKEFWRISWTKKWDWFNSFITIIIVAVFLALIFTLISFLALKYIP